MKKIIATLIFCLTGYILIAQNTQSDFSKYWYYRSRFINNHTYIGNFPGGGNVYNMRQFDYNNQYSNNYKPVGDPSANSTNNLSNWAYAAGQNNHRELRADDDQAMRLGWYIATLAMEYYLLKANNQSTDKTIEELYYALQAFDRMDELAEDDSYRKNILLGNSVSPFAGNKLNGFYVPYDFFNNSSDLRNHFNAYRYNNGINNLQLPIVDQHRYDIKAPLPGNPAWQWANGDWLSSPPTIAYHKNESVDQTVGLLTGFTFVHELVDASETYNGENINQKASDAGIRIIDYL